MSLGTICGKVAWYTGWPGSWATAGWMGRAAAPCGATASRGMAVVAAATFGTRVRHGTASGAPTVWGSFTACRGMAGDMGKGVAALSGRLGKIMVGEKY